MRNANGGSQFEQVMSVMTGNNKRKERKRQVDKRDCQ